MSGKRAKKLRRAAAKAQEEYYPAEQRQCNMKTQHYEGITPMYDREYQTHTVMNKLCGKVLVKMMKGTKAKKELENGVS